MDGPSSSKRAKITDTADESQEAASKPNEAKPGSSKKDLLQEESTLEILEQIDICQGELENLNEAASEEIISIETKFNRLRQPHIDKRNEFIQKIPNFWICTFVNHPQLSPRLSEEDEECLHYLRQLNVHHCDDLKTGYSITFHFAKNPFFENETICKEFSLTADGEPTSKSSGIQWKPGMDITKKFLKNKAKVEVPCPSFFSWFSDHIDAGNDEIADVLIDDLWSNPLQYYLIPDIDDSLDMLHGCRQSLLMDSNDSYLLSDEDDDTEMSEEVEPRSTPTKKNSEDGCIRETSEDNQGTSKGNNQDEVTDEGSEGKTSGNSKGETVTNDCS